MIPLIALWSHLLGAILYGGLALWLVRHWKGDAASRPLITAFAVMAVWSIFMAWFGPYHFLAQLADSARHLAFLTFMYGLLDGGAGDGRQRPVKAVYAAVAAVIALQIVLAGLLPRFDDVPLIFDALVSTSQMMGLAVAAGALVLVHNIYGQAVPASRGAIRLPMVALAMMWVYDLHLYTAAFLLREQPLDLYAVRGAVLALLVPLFALGLRRTTRLKVQLSRAATFQSLGLLGILVYLILMMSASRAVEWAGGDWVRIGQVTLLVLMSAAAIVLLPSAKARGWLAVVVQKHLFQHRYDYREEWLRFTNTVGGGAAGLEQRVVKALADLGGAPAGLLLVRGEDDRLTPAGRWNWSQPPAAGGAQDPCFIAFLEATAHVLDFDDPSSAQRRMHSQHPAEPAQPGDAVAVPDWIADLPGAWAGIPLVHCGRLVGLVVITHPLVRRPLDWEDYDLFRAAGRQAGSYIAEARSLEALAEARRFDEFNRRFAFILHDVKNLVSQLSLVARNAERHADNPAFRADMVATLQSSVRKMNDLLARLAPGAPAKQELTPRPVRLQPLLKGLVQARRRGHRIDLDGDARLAVAADPAALEQALAHLLQNAIDASPDNMPVAIEFHAEGSDVAIAVVDRGIGMSAEFVQSRLFQPFASTKDGGFGVGAHEARSLVEAMGGRIVVASRPGAGSRFTIHLPAADTAAAPHRISA